MLFPTTIHCLLLLLCTSTNRAVNSPRPSSSRNLLFPQVDEPIRYRLAVLREGPGTMQTSIHTDGFRSRRVAPTGIATPYATADWAIVKTDTRMIIPSWTLFAQQLQRVILNARRFTQNAENWKHWSNVESQLRDVQSQPERDEALDKIAERSWTHLPKDLKAQTLRAASDDLSKAKQLSIEVFREYHKKYIIRNRNAYINNRVALYVGLVAYKPTYFTSDLDNEGNVILALRDDLMRSRSAKERKKRFLQSWYGSAEDAYTVFLEYERQKVRKRAYARYGSRALTAQAVSDWPYIYADRPLTGNEESRDSQRAESLHDSETMMNDGPVRDQDADINFDSRRRQTKERMRKNKQKISKQHREWISHVAGSSEASRDLDNSEPFAIVKAGEAMEKATSRQDYTSGRQGPGEKAQQSKSFDLDDGNRLEHASSEKQSSVGDHASIRDRLHTLFGSSPESSVAYGQSVIGQGGLSSDDTASFVDGSAAFYTSKSSPRASPDAIMAQYFKHWKPSHS